MGKHRDSRRHVFETRLPNTGMDWDDMAEIEKAKDAIYFQGRKVPTTTMFVRDAVRYYAGYLILKYNKQQQQNEIRQHEIQEQQQEEEDKKEKEYDYNE